MPLTEAECEFLAVYVGEYMASELGPLSRQLQERGISGTDILHMLDAYMQMNTPRVELISSDGRDVEVLVWGRSKTPPSHLPWADRESAKRRNDEIFRERENTLPQEQSTDGSEASP
jgi:hypothetical protein